MATFQERCLMAKVCYIIQHSPGQGSSLQFCVSDPVQAAPPFAASIRTVLICVPPPQVTLQVPNSLHTQSTENNVPRIEMMYNMSLSIQVQPFNTILIWGEMVKVVIRDCKSC